MEDTNAKDAKEEIKKLRQDYTRDRYKILGNPTVDEIFSRIKKRRQQGEM
ncbi:hypothetical protein [Dulcicalothrix desertica]|nr:hypothetical protein [Dulcicalothrix desertica]